jgi:uncharacterized alkaline shock family protein YloU
LRAHCSEEVSFLTVQEESIPTELGHIKIADDVVAIIAGLAATEVDGVAGMSGGIAGGLSDMLGKRNLSRGVKVEVGDRQAAIDLYIIVRFGSRIPDVAFKIQGNVKNAIESMTGLEAATVNVHVQGVSFGTIKDEEDDEEPRVK